MTTDGKKTCRPGDCAYRILAPPLCGISGALCGDECPACTPRCDGRHCGPDPNCGQSCGTCGAGTYCNGSGECAVPTIPTPITVTDGKGGKRPIVNLTQPAPSDVGALKGMFSVSEQGTSAFTVPIDVPPGRAGMQPALALNYSGSRVNDDVGVGWHLDGLSKITRCPRSHALDGYSHPIKNDTTDHFCIDGKRLEAVAGVSGGATGVYGANGTEYRTLIDSFARVVSHIDDGSGIQLDPTQTIDQVTRSKQGPDSFRVWTKDGRILTFGGTRDSLVMGRNGLRYTWLLRRVEDRAGNTMTVNYTNIAALLAGIFSSSVPTVVRPSLISYTGHGSDLGNRHVRFSYETRTDRQLKFMQGGVPLMADARLSRITTFVSDVPVKNYHLVYGDGPVSQITKIFECTRGDDTHCKPPTQFEYQTESGYTFGLGPDIEDAGQLDANGDGFPDYLTMKAIVHSVDANPWLAAAEIVADVAIGVGAGFLSSGAGFAVTVMWNGGKGGFWGLFEKDPEVEVVGTMYLGTGKRQDPIKFVGNVGGIPCMGRSPKWFLDYDRDGKDDIVVGCSDNFDRRLYVARSLGNGQFESFPSDGSAVASVRLRDYSQCRNGNQNSCGSLPPSLPGPVFLDVDGDSLQDLIYCKDVSTLGLRLRLGPTEGFADTPIEIAARAFCNGPPPPPCCTHPSTFGSRPSYNIFDADGDGTSDLVVRAPDGWQILRYSISAGAPILQFQPIGLPDVGDSTLGAGLSLGDFNGDGLLDLYRSSGDQAVIWLNGADGRFSSRHLHRPQPALDLNDRFGPFSFQRTGFVDQDGRTVPVEAWQTPEVDVGNGAFSIHFFDVALPPDSLITNLGTTDPKILWPQGGLVDPDKLVPGSFRKAADLDGDGNLDLFGYNAGAFYGSGLRNRLLNRVVDGLGNVIKINYDENNTSDDPEQRTYHTDAECAGTAWPEMCLKQMSGLVSSHKEGFVAADGRDMVERSSEYHYVNARMNLTGEGWLGFDRRVIRSLASDSPSQAPTGSLHERIVTTEYEPIARYDAKGQRIDSTKAVTPPYLYPLAGLPRTITIDDYPGKSGLISTDPPGHPSIENGSYNRRTRIENEWQVRLSAFARPFPVAFRRTTKTFDRPIPAAPLPFEDNGTLLSLCQDDSAVDDYGNVVRSMERCQPEGQGFGEVHLTDTFIVPDPVNWLISNPTTIHNVSSRNGDEAAPVWGFTYTNGLLESVTRVVGDTAKQHKTTYTRDDFGNVTQILEEVASGEPSRTTAITYEIDNVFPSTITNAKGQTTQVSFDTRWGTPITIADPNDIVVQHGYDDFGRLVETRAPDGNTTTTYSNAFVAPVGHVQHIQVSVERQGTEGTRTANVVSEYDHHGQLVKTGSAGFGGVPITQEQTHDTLGRLTSSTLPHTADASVVPVDRYSYDRLLRLKRVDHSDKTFREYQYASSATLGSQYTQWLGGLTCGGVPIPLCAVNFVRTFDEQERENVVITDHRGLVVRSVDGENVENMVHSSNYTFGAFGRLIDARDNENNLTHFDYDEFGRRLGVTDPDTGLTASTYNGYDELRTTRDPKRQTRTYHYDELGRIVRIDDPAGATQWVYDQGTNALGRLSETISPATPENPSGNHVAYTYESPTPTANRGLIQRIDTTLDGTDYPIAFDYDDLSRTDRIHYPSLGSAAPIVAKYHYDTSGILTGVDEVGSNATRPLWQLQEAFQAHLIRRESFGNGASTVYDYHPHRRWLDSIQTTHGSNAVQSLEYSHWNNGLVRARTIPTESREHTYDGLNRLSSTIDTFPDGSTRSTPYTYDALGNITGRGATLINYRTDQPHLVDFVGQNSDTYGYDLNGNVNERSGPDVPGGLQTFQYMPFDLPSAIHTGTGASAKTTQFEYTADETRAVRRDTDTTRYFVGELYERVVTTAPTATLEERFRLYAGGRQLGEIVRNASGDRTLFFHTDRLGSVDTITDERPPSFQQAFDPFGMPIDPPTPAITRAGFTGHAHDDDLGLIDMRGRIYDPLAARFTSADPVMQAPFWSQGLNRYSYVFNDPVNHVDPSGFVIEGLGTWEFCGECASAVGAGSGIGGALLGAAFNAGESFLAGGLGGAKPGGTFNVPAPSAAPTSAPTGQGSMHATAQNRGGVGPSSPPPPAKGGNPAIGGGPASLPLSGGNASANPGICVLVPEICVGEALLSIFDLFTASTGRKLLDFIKDKVTPRDNEPRVDLYHGSAGPGTGRLDPHRLPVNVTRDLRAAQNALEYHPDRVPGAGFIIHSSVPKSLFDRWFLPFERPYPGFYPYIPGGSTEVPLNDPMQVFIFNSGIVP